MEQRQELLARINQTGRKLSKGQKRIAEFIVNHYDKAAFMTASRLGEKVQVSESTSPWGTTATPPCRRLCRR